MFCPVLINKWLTQKTYVIQHNDIDIIMGTLIIEWQFATINSRVSTIYGSVINNHADLIMHDGGQWKVQQLTNAFKNE